MEDAIHSIIDQWKEEVNYEGSIPVGSIEIKYADHKAGIYTLYLNLDSIVKIKAIKDLPDWKIIEMK